MSFGKKILNCPILPPMSDLTPFYGTSMEKIPHGKLSQRQYRCINRTYFIPTNASRDRLRDFITIGNLPASHQLLGKLVRNFG